MQTHRFVKEYGGWYIDLPAYLAQGGSNGDLAMVAGADTMLDIMAEGKSEVVVTMDTQPFAGADSLQLTEVCAPGMGGGYYLLPRFEGRPVQHRMWLCAVTEFVFGGLPPTIYIRRERHHEPHNRSPELLPLLLAPFLSAAVAL